MIYRGEDNNRLNKNHIQEFKNSAISDLVIALNFKSIDGYDAFAKFISECELSAKDRTNTGYINRKIQSRYAHLYEGYWYVESWHPITNEIEFRQCKPNVPHLRLDTTGEGHCKPIEAGPDHPDYTPPKPTGYLGGSSRDIYEIANTLDLWYTLPRDRDGKLDKLSIQYWTPQERYKWCYKNNVFNYISFNSIKYETPKGNGTPFIFLYLPPSTIKKVAERHNLTDTLPPDEELEKWMPTDQWDWIRSHISIDIFITEGIKKAASLISQGYIAIGSFSITTHSEKAGESESSWLTALKPGLSWLLENVLGMSRRREQKRRILLCFDAADVKKSSRKAVQRETKKLGKKLQKKGCSVYIISWHDRSCKGIDDFIVKHGAVGLDNLISSAVSLNKYLAQIRANQTRDLDADLIINEEHFPAQIIINARIQGYKAIFIKSQQNTGKTTAIKQYLESWPQIQEELKRQQRQRTFKVKDKVMIKVGNDYFDSEIVEINGDEYKCTFHTGYIIRNIYQISHSKKTFVRITKTTVLGITHRQSLARTLAKIFGINCYLNKVYNMEGKGTMFCVDSSKKIPEFQIYSDIIFDECEQIAWHMLASTTNIKFERLEKFFHLTNCVERSLDSLGMFIGADADLSNYSLSFYQNIFNLKREEILVVENKYQPFKNKRIAISHASIQSLRLEIIENLKQGKRILIHTSGQKEKSTHGTINLEKELKEMFPELKILRLDKETLGDSNHEAFRILNNLCWLQDFDVIIASSSINTGVSLDVELVGEIDVVFGIFFGNYPLDDFEQALERYRGDAVRHFYCPSSSSSRIQIGSCKYEDLMKNFVQKKEYIEQCLGSDENYQFLHNLIGHYCRFAARINGDYQNLRETLKVHLENKGYTIENKNDLAKKEKRNLRAHYQSIKNKSENAFVARVDAQDYPNRERYEELKNMQEKTKSELIEEYKGSFKERYGNIEVTEDFIRQDRNGVHPQLLMRFWLTVGFEETKKRDLRTVAKYKEKNREGYLLDFVKLPYSHQVRVMEVLKLPELLDTLKSKGQFCQDDIKEWSKRLNRCTKLLFEVFHIKIDPDNPLQTPIIRLRMILKRIGYSLEQGQRLGPRTSRRRYYSLKDNVGENLWEKIKKNWLWREEREAALYEEEQNKSA